MLSDMDLVSFAFLFGDLIVTEDEVHVVILFCERYYTLSKVNHMRMIIDPIFTTSNKSNWLCPS